MIAAGADSTSGTELERTFAILYEREAAVILGYLRAQVDERDAEDLAADTFMRAWRSWRGFRGDPAKTRAWLYRIARNLVIDHVRRIRRATSAELGQRALRPTAGKPADHVLERVELSRALGRLSSGDRDLLALRAAGLSHAEIGRIQGRSEDAVKVGWGRALQRLRAQLEEES